MTLKELALKLFDEAKAGKVGDALDTGAEFLKQFSSFYKMVFGAQAMKDDLADAEAVLGGLKADLTAHCSCVEQDGTCKQMTAMGGEAKDSTALILLVVDLILKLIASRKQPQ